MRPVFGNFRKSGTLAHTSLFMNSMDVCSFPRHHAPIIAMDTTGPEPAGLHLCQWRFGTLPFAFQWQVISFSLCKVILRDIRCNTDLLSGTLEPIPTGGSVHRLSIPGKKDDV